MLKSWRVARFKSVRSETTLPLAPLTLFAGANSAGKSTIIQSILLTAQTLQSVLHTRAVVLNGHIARLGVFSDVVSLSAVDQDILIGFDLEVAVDSERQRAFRLAGRRRLLRPIHRRGVEVPLKVRCAFSFSARGPEDQRELLQLQPDLEECYVQATANQDGKVTTEVLRFGRSSTPPDLRADRLQLADDARPGALLESLRWEVRERKGRTPAFIPARARDAGVSTNHFLPDAISVVFDTVEEQVRQVVDALTGTEHRHVESWRELTQELPEGAQEMVLTALREVMEELRSAPADQLPHWHRHELELWLSRIRAGEHQELRRSIARLQRELPAPLQFAIGNKLLHRREELREAIKAGRDPRWESRFVPLPELVSYGVDALQEYFASAVRYLGPLRDEPKPIYPPSAASASGDVGFRGEHTAAVLDVHRNTEVRYIPAPGRNLHKIAPEAITGRLIDAVLEWLRYMGVGSAVQTEDKGKLGHELRVAATDSGALHDLTHVGVGVSQVLPILVLSLLADRGATLIFEQPELHLHPRVQTRLADFFVAMTQLGKQCIVETHSEYLINRLRYRAAIAGGSEVADSVVIYFVENRGGESAYRQVRINEFGVIDDWPEGFFDENEEIAAEILRAAMRKRRSAGRGINA